MRPMLQTDRLLPYLKRDAAARPRRLLVLSHGVGGNEGNLVGLAARAPADTLVVLPRAPLALAPGQYAWFPVAFGAQGPRPDLVAADASRRHLADFVEELQRAHAIAPADTVLAGFSQGGIISASVALTRPQRVGGFGVLAGRILPELAPQLAPAEALRHLRGFIGHGRDDTKLPVAWARRADAWLTDLGIPHELHLYPGDHGMPLAMQDDFLAWLDPPPAHA